MNKTIVVTGASSGIGLALTKQLLAQQNTVLAVSRRELPIEHENLQHLRLDLMDVQAVSKVCQQYFAKQGFAALVYCAGQGIFAGLEQLDAKDFVPLMQLNCLSAMQLTKAMVPRMKQQQAGHLIYVGSEAALQGAKQGALYCASKFALRGFVQSLAAECAGSHIAVSLINPGMMATGFYDQCYFEPLNKSGYTLDLELVVDQIMLQLTSKASGYISEVSCQPYKKVIVKKAKLDELTADN